MGRTLSFCSATAQSELRDLTQLEPAAQVFLWRLRTREGGVVAAAAWGWCSQGLESPSSAQGAVARRGCSVPVLCPSSHLQGLSVIPGFSTL